MNIVYSIILRGEVFTINRDVEVLCSFCKGNVDFNDYIVIDCYYGLWHQECFNASLPQKDSGIFIDVVLRYPVLITLLPLKH